MNMINRLLLHVLVLIRGNNLGQCPTTLNRNQWEPGCELSQFRTLSDLNFVLVAAREMSPANPKGVAGVLK